MLREQDGIPHSLRQLMLEQVIPALERSPASNLVCSPTGGAGDLDIERINANLEQHQFPELCFCLRGRAEMWVDSQVAICDEHQMVVIPSGIPHSVASLHSVVSVPEDVFSRLLWISVFPFGSIVNLCESAYGIHRGTPRQFKLETGLTITEYIHSVRIDVAKRLLLAGVKVSMAADYVGFTDPYYFSRVFTKVVGYSPSEYRSRGKE